MPEPVQTIEVSVVILFDGPLMLVNKRPEGSYFGGWWEWPGGKRHGGESALECAIRELDEEIGIEAEGLAEYGVENVEYPGRRVALTFFIGRRAGDSEARQDAMEHRWLAPEEVRKLRFLEPNLPILERLIHSPPFGAD